MSKQMAPTNVPSPALALRPPASPLPFTQHRQVPTLTLLLALKMA